MSSSDPCPNRRWLVLTAPVALAACGFTPVYGPGGAGAALYGKVLVRAPEDRGSYLLVQDLEQRLGRAANPVYELTYTMTTATEGQAVTAAGDITRVSLVGLVDYQLINSATRTVVTTGSVDNFTGYSTTGSTVEELAAQRDAQSRLMTILADEIVRRLYTLDLAAA